MGDNILDLAVKESLGITNEESKYSILPCADNDYLNPEFDPFQDLEYRLLMKRLLTKYGIEASSVTL